MCKRSQVYFNHFSERGPGLSLIQPSAIVFYAAAASAAAVGVAGIIAVSILYFGLKLSACYSWPADIGYEQQFRVTCGNSHAQNRVCNQGVGL